MNSDCIVVWVLPMHVNTSLMEGNSAISEDLYIFGVAEADPPTPTFVWWSKYGPRVGPLWAQTPSFQKHYKNEK